MGLRLVLTAVTMSPAVNKNPLGLKSQGWRDNTGPVCPAEDTERIFTSTSLWQNPSVECGSPSCIWQSHGLFVMSMIELWT